MIESTAIVTKDEGDMGIRGDEGEVANGALEERFDMGVGRVERHVWVRVGKLRGVQVDVFNKSFEFVFVSPLASDVVGDLKSWGVAIMSVGPLEQSSVSQSRGRSRGKCVYVLCYVRTRLSSKSSPD